MKILSKQGEIINMKTNEKVTIKSVSDSVYCNSKITPLARNVMLQSGLEAPRVADIGCYKRPQYSFLKKLLPQASFLGVDEDKEAIQWLQENGMEGCDFQTYQEQEPFDFAFMLEVIEHIRPADSQGFLRAVLNKTKVAAFLTTPNFAGWDGGPKDKLVQKAEYKEMRYVPDHLKGFSTDSSNPHRHKQVITTSGLAQDIAAVLPEGWAFRVFLAWPWTLTDHARGTSFEHSFKVYAIMWNDAAFSCDIAEMLDTEWLPKTPSTK